MTLRVFKDNPLRVFSMFSGIGGFEYGIEQALGDDVEFVGYCETDQWANSIYRRWYPNGKNYGDATKIVPEQLPDFDMLVGGFPCQAFSIAGLQRAFQDTRGTLFFDIARICEAKRPRYILLENVKGLLSNKGGETFLTIIEVLTNLGFVLQHEVLNSRYFSVPQNRERVFVFGTTDKGIPKLFPLRENEKEPVGKQSDVSTAIDANYWKGPSKGYGGENRQLIISNPYGGFKEDEARIHPDVAPTIRTPKGGGHMPMVASVAYRTRTYKGVDGTIEARKNGEKVVNSLTSSPKDSMVALRWVRSEKGKKARSDHRKETGADKTPFNEGHRELVPVDDDVSGALTNSLNKDALIGKIASMDGLVDLDIRKLTPVECERLQGFRDGYTKHGAINMPEITNHCYKKDVWAVLKVKKWLRKPKFFFGTNELPKPRNRCLKSWDGEPYDICARDCGQGQGSHAEIRALMAAGNQAKGGTMFIIGQNRVCDSCLIAMKRAGVSGICFGYPLQEISNTQRYKTLGNAVTTTVIKSIMTKFRTCYLMGI